MNTNEAAAVLIAVTNRAGKTSTYEVNDRRREIFGGSTDEEVAVNIAVATGHVKRLQNPTAVVRVGE